MDTQRRNTSSWGETIGEKDGVFRLGLPLNSPTMVGVALMRPDRPICPASLKPLDRSTSDSDLCSALGGLHRRRDRCANFSARRIAQRAGDQLPEPPNVWPIEA